MAKHSNGGKGSNPRPFSISKNEFADKFDTIFGEKRTFCDVCGKKFSWCQCVAAPKELENAIDRALGVER
jgi:hypothetical protein